MFLPVHTLSKSHKQCVQQSRYDKGQGCQSTAREKIPFARGIPCCPKSYSLCPHHRLYTVQNMCIYTHTDCIIQCSLLPVYNSVRHIMWRCYPANHCTLQALILRPIIGFGTDKREYQFWASFLSHLRWRNTNAREAEEERERVKMGLGFKMTSLLRRPANVRVWKIMCSFTADAARGTAVFSVQLFEYSEFGGHCMACQG
jgi:hypothetical protein